MKKPEKISPVRMSGRLKDLAKKMWRLRRADDWSDYVRGLILIDAQGAGENIDGHPIPGWATEIILGLIKSGNIKSPKPPRLHRGEK